MAVYNKICLRQFVITNITFAKRYFSKMKIEPNPHSIKSIPIFEYTTEKGKKNLLLYFWGNNSTGALGRSSFVIQKFKKGNLKTQDKPWKHPFADTHKVYDIACGHGFTVIAASSDENSFTLFGSGLNTDGQLGNQYTKYGKILGEVPGLVPIHIPFLNNSTKVTQVACGRAHTLVLTDNEGVFSLGNNAFGQCGTKETYLSKLKVNKIEEMNDVSKVICGLDHSLFLTKFGEIFSCGWSADGQTGLGHYKNQYFPAKVIGDINGEKIIQISCGADCVLALSDKGEVFGWGNSEYKQLHSATDDKQINIARWLKLNLGKIKSIASGGTICAVLNEEGHVYVWGYGILGNGLEVTLVAEPTLLPLSLFGYNNFCSDVTVKHIECGLNHFAAINNKGHLYMWGKNKNNCLGLEKSDNQYIPLQVPVPAEIVKISCGTDHTGVLCKSFV